MNVRVGLVGTSGWSEFSYLQNLEDFELGKFVSISGRNEERLNELADKYSIEHRFTDWRELINSGTVDAIVVATPDRLHHDIVLEAVRAGLHVMCEKPLAMNLKDAQEMFHAVNGTNLIHNVMFTWRNLPLFRRVKEVLESKALGDIYHFDIRFNMGWASDLEYQWRLDGDEGTGALGDLGVHEIDLIHWLLGPVTSVYADTEHSVTRKKSGVAVTPINDSAVMVLELANGAKGIATVSVVFEQGDRNMDQRIMIYGSEGSLEGTLITEGAEAGMKLWLGKKGGTTEVEELGTDAWSHMKRELVGVRQFVANVASGKQSGPDFGDGLAAQRVLEAAFESDRTNKRIALSHEHS